MAGALTGDVLYTVSGTSLYSTTRLGVSTVLGTVPGSGYVTMAKAGTQIAISIGSAAGYIYDAFTASFAQITDTDFFGGTSVVAIDGYFLWSSGGSNITRFQWSGLLDGLSYDALDFASAESSETELIRPYLLGSQILMMKTDRMEVWLDTGNADSPFERMTAQIIPKGLAAKFSPAFLDNTVFWLGRDDEAGGNPVVYRLNGYVAEVISTPAVAIALAEVDPSDYDKIRGASYIKDNHAFYGLILPNGNSLWCDVSANYSWHERSTYQQSRWLGNGLISAFGKTLVGSHVNGAIYEFDAETHIDAGALPILADITLPYFGIDAELKRCARVRLDMEGGVGITTGQGSQPIVTMNVSDDRGQTYSSDMQAGIGPIGKYDYGVEWRRMGQFRSRVHRFRISDPIPRRIIACYADIV
jgi:hypothetical protein